MKYLTLAGLFAMAASQAFAQNTAIIDQVGTGSVSVEQAGENNKVTIKQIPASAKQKKPKQVKEEDVKKEAEKTPPPADYQQSVIDNPIISPRARATEALQPQPGTGNSISIIQSGGDNQAVTTQDGEHNELLIDQEGGTNTIQREQKGPNNHSKLLQNGEVIEHY